MINDLTDGPSVWFTSRSILFLIRAWCSINGAVFDTLWLNLWSLRLWAEISLTFPFALPLFCSSLKPLTAWCLSGPSGRSATSPVVKDTPFGPVWSNWSRSSAAALVPRPSRGRNARSGSAGRKQRRREEEEEEEAEEEERDGDGVNREEIQQWRSSRQVGLNNLLSSILEVLPGSGVEMLLSVVGPSRLQDAAVDQLDGLYQAMRRGDPGAVHDGEEKSQRHSDGQL